MKEMVNLVLDGTVIKSIEPEDTILVHVLNTTTFSSVAAYSHYIKYMEKVKSQLEEKYKCAVLLVPAGTKVEMLKFNKGNEDEM